MEGVVHAMHPVERDQLGADDLGKELDLRLDVLGANREMMDSISKTHNVPPVDGDRFVRYRYAQSVAPRRLDF